MDIRNIAELGSFTDDYQRAGIEKVEDLAVLTVTDLLALGISGIGETRAEQHIAACKQFLIQHADIATEQPAKAKPVQDTLATHPTLAGLEDKQVKRVISYAKNFDGVTDPVEWLDSIGRRAAISGDPEFFMNRFVTNLHLRLV